MQTSFGRFSQISIVAAAFAALAATTVVVHAQSFPVTPDQKTAANQVALSGVALADLAPNAPDSYSVKQGDTLWAISGLFLKSP